MKSEPENIFFPVFLAPQYAQMKRSKEEIIWNGANTVTQAPNCDAPDSDSSSLCPTWKLAGVPDDDSVVHAAGGQPHIMGGPRYIHHICKQDTPRVA